MMDISIVEILVLQEVIEYLFSQNKILFTEANIAISFR